MKDIANKFLLIIIVLLILFILPTHNLISTLIHLATGVNNIYFELFCKILIFLILIYIFLLDLPASIQYGAIYKFKTHKFLRNPVKYIAILIIGSELFIVTFLRTLDLSGQLYISSDSWMNFIGSLIGSTLTALGILVSINKYFKDKEEKESPKLISSIIKDIPEGSSSHSILQQSNKVPAESKIISFNLLLTNKGINTIRDLTFVDYNTPTPKYHYIIPHMPTDQKQYLSIFLDVSNEYYPDIRKVFTVIYRNENFVEYSYNLYIHIDTKNENKCEIRCSKPVINYDKQLGEG